MRRVLPQSSQVLQSSRVPWRPAGAPTRSPAKNPLLWRHRGRKLRISCGRGVVLFPLATTQRIFNWNQISQNTKAQVSRYDKDGCVCQQIVRASCSRLMCLPIRPCQPLRSWQSSLIRNPWPRLFFQLTSLHDRLLHGQARRSSLQDARRTNMRFAASRRTPSRTAHSVAASGAPFEVVHRTAPLSSLCPCLLP